MMKRRQSGFTLLELSLVLLIIGLIMAGILVGQSVVRTARIRNATGDLARYTQAFNNFRDKYKALPGDFYNARNFWGTDSGGCPNASTGLPATPYSAALQQATCNGNGDGHIGDGNLTAGGAQDFEVFRAWQQLSASGLMNDISTTAFNGISGSGSSLNAVVGINVPMATMKEAGFTVIYQYVTGGGDSNHFTNLNNHVLILGTAYTNGLTYGALLTPIETLAIDNKLDDGLPGSGNIQTFKTTLNPNCTTSATAYNTGYTSNACAVMYITNF